jgi:general stress protein YciG
MEGVSMEEETKAPTTSKSKRGFAVMSPEKRLELARRGGKSAHEKGVAYTFNSETARAAAKKGAALRKKEPT